MDATPDLAIEAADLVKDVDGTRAADGVDLEVAAGSVYGLLGPEGAGKTTTVRMLATLLRPDHGRAWVFGHDIAREPDAVRTRIGLTGRLVDEGLSGLGNLALVARMLGHSQRWARERAADLLDSFGLGPAGDRPVGRYSGVMRRRLDLAAGIIATPELLLLDEPTMGLDPRGRTRVWDIVRAVAAEGTTVLLTTQYLDEADQLTDRVAVLDHGRVIAEGTVAGLKTSVGAGTLRVRLRDPADRPQAERIIAHTLGVPARVAADPAALSASGSADDDERVARTLAELSRAGVEVTDVAFAQPRLDEVFLALTGPAEVKKA